MKSSKGAYTQMRIKLAAIRLFNEDGVETVSLRDVATAVDLAYGNLTYYFPTKKALVLAIYRDFKTDVNDACAELTSGQTDTLRVFFDFPQFLGPVLQRYRFALLDFHPTFRVSAGARLDLRQSYEQWKDAVIASLQKLTQEGFLDPSDETDHLARCADSLALSLLSLALSQTLGLDPAARFEVQFRHQVYLMLNAHARTCWKKFLEA